MLLSFFCCCFRCFCCCFRCFCCCFRCFCCCFRCFCCCFRCFCCCFRCFCCCCCLFFCCCCCLFFCCCCCLLFFCCCCVFFTAAAFFLLLLLFFFCCCCCFFYSDTTENKTTESESWKLAPQSRKPSITEDLTHQRHVPSGWCWADQQGRGESASCAARQDVAPSPSPSSLRASLQDKWHLPGSGLGESTRKLGSLGGPPATHLSTKDNEACPPALTCKLRVRTFLPSSSLLQSCTIHGRCSVPSRRTGDTIAVSMASCAPCHSVRPSATTSSLRPSNLLCCARSRSRTNTLADT